MLFSGQIRPKDGYAYERGLPTHLLESAATSFLEQWSIVRYACFAGLLLAGPSPVSLLLRGNGQADTGTGGATI